MITDCMANKIKYSLIKDGYLQTISVRCVCEKVEDIAFLDLYNSIAFRFCLLSLLPLCQVNFVTLRVYLPQRKKGRIGHAVHCQNCERHFGLYICIIAQVKHR